MLRENGYEVDFIDCLNPFHPEIAKVHNIKIAHRKHQGHGKYPKEEISKPHVLNNIPMTYNRYGIPPALFRESLHCRKTPAAVFVTSMMTYWYPGIFEAIRIIHEELPGVPVVLGGNYVTLCSEHARNSGADYTISGSIGEIKITALLKELTGDDIVLMPDLNNLDSFTYPAYDLLAYQDQVPILTSRGCPFKCSYCASPILNQTYCVRDPIKVVDEIEFWRRRLGICDFSFYDDALLVNPHQMVVPMMQEIIKRNLNCRFHCPNGLHLRYIDHEIGSLMFQSGFETIRFGFESSDSQIQIKTGGKVKNSHLEEAVCHLKKAGYQTDDIGIYLLCGMPGQTFSDVLESIHFVKRCGAKPILAEYSPIPGTGLWPDSIDSSPYPIQDEPLFQNNSLLPCQNEKLSYSMYRKLKSIARDTKF
jgi:radical SAM superfamily enzyme YgiQ (UPF0313 family)